MAISLNFREAAYAQETGRVPIALITLSHSSLTDDIRISTDPTERIHDLTTDEQVIYGTISRGQTYLFLPVRIKLPDDTDDGPGELQLEIDNIHRAYMEAIRTVFTPIACRVDIVMDNALDVVDIVWPEFRLTQIKYDDKVITGTLTVEMLMTEPFPAGNFVPSYTPGVF